MQGASYKFARELLHLAARTKHQPGKNETRQSCQADCEAEPRGPLDGLKKASAPPVSGPIAGLIERNL